MIQQTLIATIVLGSSICVADTIEIQPTQSGCFTHTTLCCGLNYYYDTTDSAVWISECLSSPFGCSSGDLAAVWRWDMSALDNATINNASH